MTLITNSSALSSLMAAAAQLEKQQKMKKEQEQKPATIHASPSFFGKLYGIELEIEAPGLYDQEIIFDEDGDEIDHRDPVVPMGWLREQEDSIQGVELISAQPFDLKTSMENIDRVFADIKQMGYTPIRTCRGSTHVHANVADLTWEQMKHFVTACAWAEPALIEIAGKGRKGNLFAQSYKDTPVGWSLVIDWVRKQTMAQTYDTHYMAVSFHPMSYLGSVEFRMGPSARNAEDAIAWLLCIDQVVEAGRNEKVTGETVPSFLHELLMRLPEKIRTRTLVQGAAQAAEVWEAMSEPYTPPQRLRSRSKNLASAHTMDAFIEHVNSVSNSPSSFYDFDFKPNFDDNF